MITEILLSPLFHLWQWLDSTLPDGTPIDETGLGGLMNTLGTVNAFVPVAEVWRMALTLLSLVAAFMAGRFLLVLRHTLLP
jgi:hypothetical protein